MLTFLYLHFSRGVIFGYGKRPASDSIIQFIRKYHGYAMSFGTVLNFHYHPVVIFILKPVFNQC